VFLQGTRNKDISLCYSHHCIGICIWLWHGDYASLRIASFGDALYLSIKYSTKGDNMKNIIRICKEDIYYCLCDKCQNYQYDLEMAEIKHAKENCYNPEPGELDEREFFEDYYKRVVPKS